MNKNSSTLLSTLLFGALLPLGCGSAATGSDVESSAQAAKVADQGVVQVAASADPGDVPRKGRHGRYGWFRRLDADGDGRVAIADLPEHARTRLAAADTNHDGFITRDEIHAMRQGKFAQMKAEADTNHDGTVSDEERRAARVHFVEARLLKHDTNGDHALTPDEVSADKWERIKKADSNGDGRVTSDEIAAAAENGTLGRFHHRGGHGPKSGPPPAVL
jgi:Ca2+-binding EF-hand superfamily protein